MPRPGSVAGARPRAKSFALGSSFEPLLFRRLRLLLGTLAGAVAARDGGRFAPGDPSSLAAFLFLARRLRRQNQAILTRLESDALYKDCRRQRYVE